MQTIRVNHAEYVAGATESLPASGLAEFAFAGRSNVGKSSLLNAIMQRKGLVRTSKTPGCTRQLNLFKAELSKEEIYGFVDLPGYGFAKRSGAELESWGKMIETYLMDRAELKAVICLVDVRRGVAELDHELTEFMKARPAVKLAVAVTKIDKLSKAQRVPILAEFKRAAKLPLFATSAEEGLGIEELWNWLRRSAGDASAVAPS